ncbi:MAG: DinB family protein [Vicinamibacterales bacterium]
MTITAEKNGPLAGLPAATLTRILDEGYGPGAWFGSNMQTALAGVTAADAFRRPAPGRHNIAEIALHHAYWAHQIQKKLTGAEAGAFPLEGEDWFELAGESPLPWERIRETVAAAHQGLAKAIVAIGADQLRSPLGEVERFDLVIGITGHAAYHAGQIQLVKKLL